MLATTSTATQPNGQQPLQPFPSHHSPPSTNAPLACSTVWDVAALKLLPQLKARLAAAAPDPSADDGGGGGGYDAAAEGAAGGAGRGKGAQKRGAGGDGGAAKATEKNMQAQRAGRAAVKVRARPFLRPPFTGGARMQC